MRTPRRLLVSLLAVVAVLPLAGCGQDGVISQAEGEGFYVTLNDVKYQVQLSRILNPGNVEDRAYLQGITDGETPQLSADEAWFAVFLRAENEVDEPRPKAEEFEIVDTLGQSFEALDLEDNILAWGAQPETIPPEGLIPIPGSIAASGTVQGSLLLFRMPYSAFENRPLEFEIHGPASDAVASITLDV